MLAVRLGHHTNRLIASATLTPNRSRLGHGQTGPVGQSRLRNVSNAPNALHAAQSTPRHRQPLNRISPNGNAINGVGMSAGLKVGRLTGKCSSAAILESCGCVACDLMLARELIPGR